MELPYNYNTNSCNVFCSWIAWEAAALCNLKWVDWGKGKKGAVPVWQWVHRWGTEHIPHSCCFHCLGSLGLNMGSSLALGNIPELSSCCCRIQLTVHSRASFRNAVISSFPSRQSLTSACQFALLFHLLHQELMAVNSVKVEMVLLLASGLTDQLIDCTEAARAKTHVEF